MIHKYSPILSSSTLICIVIVFSAINKPIALILAQNFGLGRISIVIIYFVFCLFLLRPNLKLYKAHSLLYLFSIFLLFRGLIFFLNSEMNGQAFIVSFTGFRLYGVPIIIFIYFNEKFKNQKIFEQVNHFLEKWFVFTVFYTLIDWIFTNSLPFYADYMFNFWSSNMGEFVERSITANDEQVWGFFGSGHGKTYLLSNHIPFMSDYIRSFGLFLDLHASGMYVSMLYSYMIFVKQRMPLWLDLFSILACLVNGSLLAIALVSIIQILRVKLIYKTKIFLIVLFLPIITLFTGFLAEFRFTFIKLQTVYLFELLDIVKNKSFEYYFNFEHLSELLWGYSSNGNLDDQRYIFAGVDNSLASLSDIGIVRFFLNTGFVLSLFYVITLIAFYIRFVSPYKGKERGIVSGAVLAILIGHLGMIHLQVLFAVNNVILYMYFLAVISSRYSFHKNSLLIKE
jgi:hypothetical protein